MRSEAQRRLMYAAAKGDVEGVSKKVAKEFVSADKPGKLPERVKKTAKEKATHLYTDK
jgi:hypothetical protein